MLCEPNVSHQNEEGDCMVYVHKDCVHAPRLTQSNIYMSQGSGPCYPVRLCQRLDEERIPYHCVARSSTTLKTQVSKLGQSDRERCDKMPGFDLLFLWYC